MTGSPTGGMMSPKRLEADDVSASRETAAVVVVVVAVAGGHVSLSLSLTESEACLCCHSKLHSFTLLLRTRSPNHLRTACCCCCCNRRVWHYISCQSPSPPLLLLMHNRRAFPGARPGRTGACTPITRGTLGWASFTKGRADGPALWKSPGRGPER